MGEYKLLNGVDAEKTAYYLKQLAMHEGDTRQFQLSTRITQGTDKDNIPYVELVIQIPFTNRG